MRWTYALLAGALVISGCQAKENETEKASAASQRKVPVPPPPQENEAEKLYRAFEQKLTSAKSYRVDLETEEWTNSGNGSQKLKAEVILAAGNKLRISQWFQDREGKWQMAVAYVSDGKRLFPGGKGLFGGPGIIYDVVPSFGKNFTLCLVEGGYMCAAEANLHRPNSSSFPLDDYKLTQWQFKLAGKEKLGDREAQIVEFPVGEQGPPKAIGFKVWFDTSTQMPLKRTFDTPPPEAGYRTTKSVDIYSRWEIEPVLNGDEFTPPE